MWILTNVKILCTEQIQRKFFIILFITLKVYPVLLFSGENWWNVTTQIKPQKVEKITSWVLSINSSAFPEEALKSLKEAK